MSETQEKTVENASFTIAGGTAFKVQFNPQSLQYSVSNTLKGGQKEKVAQHVTRTTGKLSMELIFDTTHDGKDVRGQTSQIAVLMQPKKPKNSAPPKVTFSWGNYKFVGILESFRETIDFFAPNGTPLRSSVSVTLLSHKVDFSPELNSPFDEANKGSLSSFAGSGRGLSQLAAKGGNPAAARALGEINNVENLRFPGKAGIEINASLDLGAGVGGRLSAGASLGGRDVASAAIGGKLSAGVSASAGAFAGLRTSASLPKSGLDLDSLVGGSGTAGLNLSAQASIGLGGQASAGAGGSATVEVGKAGDLKTHIEFDEG